MIKKFIDTIILLISSGAVFHRCTFVGALCAAWVVFGTNEDGNMFRRLFTGDLYLFMGAFVVFYRLVFKKTLTAKGDPDLQATAVYAANSNHSTNKRLDASPFLIMQGKTS